jgi:predicted RNA methylase
MPDAEARAVLDLGCGAGVLCRKIKSLGADSVTGWTFF